MLRRADNVSLAYKAGWLTGKGTLHIVVGKRSYIVQRKLRKSDFRTMLDRSGSYPVCIAGVDNRAYWLFGGRWHWDNDGLNADQVYALLVTRGQRQQATINRAQSMVAMQQQPQPSRRGTIPDDLKQWVWTRDGGQCRQCGSNVELQFDHIIPVAYGGATTAENLQILCGPCNRRKGASVV